MVVKFHDPVENIELSYYIEPKVIRFLDSHVKDRITKKDKDYVLLIDGYEGAGKSTFAQQIAKYVDPTLDITRICMTADEFKTAIIEGKKHQCIIYDEAVTGMTAGDSISRVGKLLKSLMMQMRQNNLFVIVILPTLFELNKYAVLSRAKFLFHIYENKGEQGYFAGYNQKDLRKLYLKGKKDYSYRVRSPFTGRFYGKYVINEDKYRQKKKDALSLLDEPEEAVKPSKVMAQRDALIAEFSVTYGLSGAEIARICKKNGSEISDRQVQVIISKFHGLKR